MERSLRDRALTLLARREHSRVELARKLAPHGEPDEIAALLDDLESRNYLSDARYAEALGNSRAGRYGSQRLKQELREKGVAEHLATEVLSAARDHDLAAARAAWEKKFGQPAADFKARGKQLRFLIGRGFPLAVARQVVGGEDA